MYKKLTFIFLLTTSLQAMPKTSQEIDLMKKEVVPSVDSDNESRNSASSKESPVTCQGSPLLQPLPKIELMEEEVSSGINNLNEAIKFSNEEKENLLQKYEKAANLLEEKQKELEEIEGEADQLADKARQLAAQRDEYKKELEVQKSVSQLIFNLIGKSAKEIEEVAAYARKMHIRGEEK